MQVRIMSQSDNSREGILGRSGIANDVPQGIGKAPWTNTPAAPLPSALRTALAGLIGNVLEWFDFAVYGYFASDIGHLFFLNRALPGAALLLCAASLSH